MALVTVTGNVTDITGSADIDPFEVFTPYVRDGVLSTRRKRVYPDASGAFAVQMQEGAARAIIRGTPYDFTATAGDLWTLIKVGLSVPPSTAAQKLTDAVNAWATAYADGKYATTTALTGKADLQGGKLNPAQLPATAATTSSVAAAVAQVKTDISAGVGVSLDTLKELADAVGNDANFSVTITNLIGQKYMKPAGGVPLTDLKKADLDAVFAAIAQAVPSGGSAGQVLTRVGATAFGWVDAPTSSGTPGYDGGVEY